MDRTGTAYLSSAGQQTEVPGRLGAVVTVSAEGRLGKLRLPARITGLTGSPAEFKVGWPAGDDANGVFALVYDSSGDNRAIVHLHSGRADLVAHENARTGAGTPCRITHLVDALRLPCPLPMAMTYRSGSLILGGLKDFVLRIRVA